MLDFRSGIPIGLPALPFPLPITLPPSPSPLPRFLAPIENRVTTPGHDARLFLFFSLSYRPRRVSASIGNDTRPPRINRVDPRLILLIQFLDKIAIDKGISRVDVRSDDGRREDGGSTIMDWPERFIGY